MTVRRSLMIYLAAGALVTAVLGAADGLRGLFAGATAGVVCLVPLLRWPHRRVAADVAGPRIAGKWGVLQSRSMLFRLTWVLGVGALLYQGLGERLGAGFWIALIVDYQVMLALSVVRLLRALPSGRPALNGDPAPDVPGR
jgi:hypothetical protein